MTKRLRKRRPVRYRARSEQIWPPSTYQPSVSTRSNVST